MKTLEQLKDFAAGYRAATHDPACIDDWLEWGGYDLNICGSDSISGLSENDLVVYAFPEGWRQTLPEPIHTFIV